MTKQALYDAAKAMQRQGRVQTLADVDALAGLANASLDRDFASIEDQDKAEVALEVLRVLAQTAIVVMSAGASSQEGQ